MSKLISTRYIEKMRHTDYQSSAYAIAEIVDNSIDAGADIINIIAIEKRDAGGHKYIDELLFCDNGKGMTDVALDGCLTLGEGENFDDEQIATNKTMGKFGMGLPNSSLNQCRFVSVHSKSEKLDWRLKYLSIDELIKNDSIDLPDFAKETLPSYLKEVGAIVGKKNGTIISWKDCDELDRKTAISLFNNAEDEIGLLFRNFINGKGNIALKIFEHNLEENSYTLTSDKNVQINDPLFIQKNTLMSKYLWQASEQKAASDDADPSVYYKKYLTKCKKDIESHPTSGLSADGSFKYSFEWKGKKYDFNIRTSIADLDIRKPGISDGGGTKVGQRYRKKMDAGNICFTRHGRQIAQGTFRSKNESFYNTADLTARFWTVEVDFGSDSDYLMGVSNTKQGIKFKCTKTAATETWDQYRSERKAAREQCWFELTTKIHIAIKALSAIIRTEASAWDSTNSLSGQSPLGSIVSGTSATFGASGKTDGLRKNKFTKGEKNVLVERLIDKFPKLPEKDISNAVDKFNKFSVKGVVLYAEIIDSPQLWTLSYTAGVLIIFVNTNHIFYQNIIQPFITNGVSAPRTAIELFISSLAWEEYQIIKEEDSEKVETLSDFRGDVGKHLKNYLIQNDIKLIGKDFIKEK